MWVQCRKCYDILEVAGAKEFLEGRLLRVVKCRCDGFRLLYSIQEGEASLQVHIDDPRDISYVFSEREDALTPFDEPHWSD